MTVKIDRCGAEVLAALAIEDLRGYSHRFPEAHAAYLAIKKRQQAEQNRNTHKGNEIGGVNNER